MRLQPLFLLSISAIALLVGCAPLNPSSPSSPTSVSSPPTITVTNATQPSQPGTGSKASVNPISQSTPPSRPSLPVLSEGATSPAVLRLQQLLSSLGYLPVTWHPQNASERIPQNAGHLSAIQNPPAGTWSWTYTDTPTSLQKLWQAGTYNIMVKGAVMTFELANHLQMDGVTGPLVWHALFRDALTQRKNPYGYEYVYVSKTQPETLHLWRNGREILTTAANTGIAAAPTPLGTWPVYLRYRTQTMSGYDPQGHYYRDPNIPYVSYFYGGDAVHGFVRAQYGYPQSLGCVEIPPNEAAIAWQNMQYGTLVTILG